MSRYNCSLTLFLLPAAFAVGMSGLAQVETPVITADVRQVLVPVVVTDKKGHHIRGLKAEDFEVSEDGTPQKILAFSSSSEPSPTVTPKASGAVLNPSMATSTSAPVDAKRPT